MSIVNKVKDVLWLHILFKLYRRSYCCLVGLNIFVDLNDINDINDIYIYNIYMAHHFILLRRNPFGLRVDRDGWWFEHSRS